MPSCNIIVDSCSYFRLAQNIRPLLKNPFGREKYCLGVIEELDKEYEKNPTLKNKFFWVSQNEYSHNRKKCFSPTTRKRSEINHAFFFIREFARESQFSVSEVDIIALAYAYVLKITVVTDDSDHAYPVDTGWCFGGMILRVSDYPRTQLEFQASFS